MSSLQVANDANFHERVVQRREPVLVYFWAVWCAPCRHLTPTLERLADELAGQVRIVKVDVDDSVSLAVSHDIQSAPTLVLYHNGVPVGMNTRPTARASALKLLEPVLQR